MYTAFPCSDYYEPSALLWRHQSTVDLPVDQQAAGRRGQHHNSSHVHHAPVDRIDAQLCPCSPSTVTPQTFTVATSSSCKDDFGVAPSSIEFTHAAARPISTRLEPVPLLRRFNRWFNRYVSLSRLPGPDRLAVPTRPVVVRAASHPPPHL
jgi:hypothetical protein